MATRSRLICALLCMATDKKTQSVHNITNRIALSPPRLPAPAAVTMFVGIASESYGPYPLQISIRRPSGSLPEPLMTVTIRVPKGEIPTAYLPVQIVFEVHEWGMHWFDVSVEGENRTSVPLIIEGKGQSQTPAPPPS